MALMKIFSTRKTPRHIMLKMTRSKNRDRILKVARLKKELVGLEQ